MAFAAAACIAPDDIHLMPGDPTRRDMLHAIGAFPLAATWPVTARAGATRLTIALADHGGGPNVHDNSIAFRAALAALAAAGGGILHVAPGVHRFASASLGMTGIALPSGITIRGSGRDVTRLEITGTTVGNLFVATNQSALAFEDMAIVGNGAVPPGASVYGAAPRSGGG